jgi:hypothetical protein
MKVLFKQIFSQKLFCLGLRVDVYNCRWGGGGDVERGEQNVFLNPLSLSYINMPNERKIKHD